MKAYYPYDILFMIDDDSNKTKILFLVFRSGVRTWETMFYH